MATPCSCFRRWPVADVIDISDAPIDTAELQRSLNNPAAGGYCAFEGWVRNENEGHVVERLEYEAYKPLAITEGEKVLAISGCTVCASRGFARNR